MSDFDLASYLTRVGLDELPADPVERLQAMHRAQALAIPFEVFDIHLGRGISVEPAEVFDKLVHHQRGGYCFELNTLFAGALEAAGLHVQRFLARVHFMRPSPGPRTHLVLVVGEGSERRLADVGFGGPGLIDPIPLESGHEFEQAGATFRLRKDDVFGYVLERQVPEGWMPLYAFSFESYTADDLTVANHFTATHPASPFVRMRMCARATPEGRTTLANFELTHHRADEMQTHTLQPGATYLDALREHFGIVLDAPYEDLKPLEQ